MNKFKAGIITVSDRCSKGIYEDKSGPEIKRILEENGYEICDLKIVSDGIDEIKAALLDMCGQTELIITTGGTGLSPRDNTPEATMEIAEKNVPGISEAIRIKSMQITNRAMLGRGVSVIRDNTLIINLPGSVKAVRESLEFIIDVLPHALSVLGGKVEDCGR